MRRFSPGLFLLLVILVADQVSKWLILNRLAATPVIELTSFFNLVLVGNRGISFGLFNSDAAHNPWILSLLALVIGVGLVIWLAREPRSLPRLAIFAVLGGAIGNVIDRLRFGFVVDFLDFHLKDYHWPAFNVADSAIVIGAIVLLLDGLLRQNPARSVSLGHKAKEKG
ncbi:signal peptidase II Aspartic peptidase. MEROPS family A08 [Arboricoccus pini]|uniref:Lipoprotein signal peptidase n=1 Tax=Arboricoccus pini TaxID=1963835 RepID=A0A212Q432_9PROT|nr:signal peptidase II [Arboricoccus pini]SNB54037.1 signal peptidase II Aspartic peptidase. MEROPS family A08 [Arboricoccus pini]